MIYISEMPERSPAGELPRPIDVLLDDDLVDRVKPGDRISVVGTYRTLGKGGTTLSATFRTLFIANNVSVINKEINAPLVTEDDAREIRKISKRKDVFSLVSSSLAPSLYGHEYIKKSLLLLMLGGIEKNLENGTHLRGYYNN
jgi:DNA replication licensing factor MCM3